MMTIEGEDEGGGEGNTGRRVAKGAAAAVSTNGSTVTSLAATGGVAHEEAPGPVSLSQLFQCAEKRKSSGGLARSSLLLHLDCSIPENASAVLQAAALENRVMGNGTSSLGGNSCSGSTSPPPRPPAPNTTGCTVITGRENAEQLRLLVPRLKREARDWEDRATTLETQVTDLKLQLSEKDEEVLRLLREVHKLRSVLQQHTGSPLTPTIEEVNGGLENGSSSLKIEMKPQMLTPSPVSALLAAGKRQGVSGESSDTGQAPQDIHLQCHEKDPSSKQLIRNALLDNDLLKNLDPGQVREVVDCMVPQTFRRGSYVIREGTAGSHLYVSAEGEFEVTKDKNLLGTMGPGKAFGELAILYNCTRTASVRVVRGDAQIWVLERRIFQQIMLRTGLQRLHDNVRFLRSVPLLQRLSGDKLARIADVLEVEFYAAGAYIVRQGASGDTFFIISQGSVKVTQRIDGEEQEIRTLESGDYFGEQALLKTDCRTANVVAIAPGVECLTLDRDSFIQLIGELSELQDKDYRDSERQATSRPNSAASSRHDSDQLDVSAMRVGDLESLATLGVGGFGRVELVQCRRRPSLVFALKRLKKQHVVETQQQEHVLSEKTVMLKCHSPFICRLYRTFRDSKYVYLLLEACLGGEVWSLLRDRGSFDEPTTRFVSACVVQALDYLHSRNYVYRDLKPENLLLDSRGYVKLADFGFAKRLSPGSKTWTFCGTPEYVSPEVILNKGHDRAVDYWALGVLLHELLSGTPPFTSSDPMQTYGMILKGMECAQLPRHTTRAAQSLVRRLCRESPSERLGYQRGGVHDIRKHKWYQGFDWDGLEHRTLQSPLQRPIRSPTDVSYFDTYPEDKDIPPDEFSGWDASF